MKLSSSLGSCSGYVNIGLGNWMALSDNKPLTSDNQDNQSIIKSPGHNELKKKLVEV